MSTLTLWNRRIGTLIVWPVGALALFVVVIFFRILGEYGDEYVGGLREIWRYGWNRRDKP
jgi:hypothetical protein